MLTLAIPGGPAVELRHLVLDANGTVSARGALITGVPERVALLAERLEVHLATADTFGTGESLAAALGASFARVANGDEKVRLVARLGAEGVVAIGNGRNDVGMFRAARLSIAVIGPEGVAGAALSAADVVCTDILDALDLLLDARALAATLRP